MSNPEHSSLNPGRQHKITEYHLQRLAYIYVRQSSPKQVLHNRESQFNQYQLVQRAEKLGWKHERIRVTGNSIVGKELAKTRLPPS